MHVKYRRGAVYQSQASAEDIIKWADIAMYQTKEAGRNLMSIRKNVRVGAAVKTHNPNVDNQLLRNANGSNVSKD